MSLDKTQNNKAVNAKSLYDWAPKDKDCPDDIVVNAGNAPLVIGSPKGVPFDSPRMDVGDRRQGEYYIKSVIGLGLGIARLKDLSIERARALEETRRLRTGEEPAEWIKNARKRAASGGPETIADAKSNMTSLQKAALGLND